MDGDPRYVSTVLATGQVRFTNCDTTVIVFPHTLYGIVPSRQRSAFLAEAERTETDGKRFAVADETGAWTCPRARRRASSRSLTSTDGGRREWTKFLTCAE